MILIHGSRGDSQLVPPRARRLVERFAVYAFDSPGLGGSDALPSEKKLCVADIAVSYRDALNAAGLGTVAEFGTHTGSAIGLELARRNPTRVAGYVLEGVPIFTPDEPPPLLAEDYMPRFEPDVLGCQYSRTSSRFHHQFLWFPWNERDVAHLNETEAGSSPGVHLWVSM